VDSFSQRRCRKEEILHESVDLLARQLHVQQKDSIGLDSLAVLQQPVDVTQKITTKHLEHTNRVVATIG